jgi:hypothetical protein
MSSQDRIFFFANPTAPKEQPIRPVDLRDDEVDIDFLSREEIEEALKYLKNN